MERRKRNQPGATGLSAGTYTISVVDNHGCTGSSSVVITNNYISVATSVTNVLCNGGVGTATIKVGTLVSMNFNYEKAVQNISIPISASTVTVSVTGARGGEESTEEGTTGTGPGASFSATFPITPGDVLSVAVGALAVPVPKLQAAAAAAAVLSYMIPIQFHFLQLQAVAVVPVLKVTAEEAEVQPG